MAATAMRMLWGPGAINTSGGAGSSTSFSLNAATDELSWIFVADRAGVIDTLSFRVTTVTGAARTWDVSIEALDAAGAPDGVDFGGSTPGVLSPAAAGNELVAMGVGATVAQGDFFAVRLVPTGTAPDGANFINVQYTVPTYSGNSPASFPLGQASTNNGATWTKNANMPSVGIRYASGDWIAADLTVPGSLGTVTQYDSADSPNEYGARFQVPYLMECFGVRFASRSNTLIHPTVHLYDAASAELRSVQYWARTAQNRTVEALWAPIDLAANTTYFIGQTNPSAVSTIGRPWYVTLDDADKRGGFPFCDGLRWAGASRTGAGAWTVTDTELPMMALYVSGVG